jgi:putative glycosyltransferase (TIGR04348 family)
MIRVVTPTVPSSNAGNGVTARRWARILTDLGHQVVVAQRYRTGDEAAALVALHARKSADSVRAFRAERPHAPLIIAMTGTDVYPDPLTAGVDPAVLALADRLIVLQSHALTQLDPALRSRTRVILQSVPTLHRRPPRTDCFEVAQVAHLRPVKDPLRVAYAARRLPPDSRVRVTHVGAAYDADAAAAAVAESADNLRYDWLGPVPRAEALALVARGRLLVLGSRHEGGANVISEALAAGTPIVASRIPGTVGLLGEDYPGYFAPGDTDALADAIDAAESDRAGFYGDLQARCQHLRPLVEPVRETTSWATLLKELDLSVPV